MIGLYESISVPSDIFINLFINRLCLFILENGAEGSLLLLLLLFALESTLSLLVADDVIDVASGKLILRRPNADNGAAKRVVTAAGCGAAVGVDCGGVVVVVVATAVEVVVIPLVELALEATCCNANRTIFWT